jgi:transposase
VAVEAMGSWYWIVEEVERAGMEPRLVHARKAKLMMGMLNKTDKLDARGLNLLQRNGTLPTVWIPPSELRDLRELTRTRMVLVQQRTRLKNRIHATLAKYALTIEGVSDLFGTKGRQELAKVLEELPPYAAQTVGMLLEQLDGVERHVGLLEEQMQAELKSTEAVELLMTIPGVGFILASVIALELGDVGRFPSASHFASYAGTTPRVHSSGGKTRYGRLRSDVNHYLQWAFVEAANVNAIWHKRRPLRHASQVYARVRERRGNHGTAIGAVARHLAEAAYWVLRRKEAYREPHTESVSSTGG